MEEIELNFNVNEKELECLEIHSIFKNNGVYDDLKYSSYDFDKVKVWYDMTYNDCYYDGRPVYFDLIKEGKIVGKISGYGNEIEYKRKNNVTEGGMLSFIINKEMIN